MATISIDAQQYKKADGIYRVRIRIIHKGNPVYIATETYVTKKGIYSY